MTNAIARMFAPPPAGAPLSDGGLIDSLYRRNRLLVMIAITGGYGLSYTCRLALGVVKKPLIDGGIFSPADLGLIGSAFFYAYAFGKLTNGFLADHVSPRAFLVFGILVSAFCNFGMGASTLLWLAVALWGLNGWFQSFGAPASVVAMTQWFTNGERGRFFGIWSTSHSIGEGLTFIAASAIVGAFGWRAGFFAPAMLCVLTAGVCWWMMKERPQALGLPSVALWKTGAEAPVVRPAEPGALLKAQVAILAYPSVWILALSAALMYVTRYAINSWGILYLQEAHHYSVETAGLLLGISTFAGVVGAVGYGYVSDLLFKARRPPASLIFAVAEVAGLLLFFFGPPDFWIQAVAMVLFGLGMTGLVTSVGLFATDICPKHVAGAALGVVGVFSYLGAALQENISGGLIEAGLRTVGGAKVYDFGPVILFWVGSSVVSMLLAACLWRVKARD